MTLPWGEFAHPTSSYNKAVPLVGIDPDDHPQVEVQFAKAWLPYVLGALTQLLLQTTWASTDKALVQLEQSRADDLIRRFSEAYPIDQDETPFWDDADAADADDTDLDAPLGTFPWYEEFADGVVTAFLMTSFTPGAAIKFVTTARKFRLAFRSRDYGAVVRVFLNDVLNYSIDTYSSVPGVVYADILVPSGLPADVTMRIEHSGTHNVNAIPVSGKYGMEVLRKRLSEDDMGIQDIRLTGGQLEVQRSIGGAWSAITGGEVVRRDGALVPDVTADFNVDPGAIRFRTSGDTGQLAGVLSELRIGSSSPSRSAAIIRASMTAPGDSLSMTTAILWSVLFMQQRRASSTGTVRETSSWRSGFDTSTDATRKTNFTITTYDATGEREVIRGGTNGSAPMIGVLGAAASPRITVTGDDGGNLALRSLIAAFATFGWITDGTTHGSASMGIILRQNPDNQYQLQQSANNGVTWTLAYDYSWLLSQGGTPPPGWDINDPGTIAPDAPENTFTLTDGDTNAQAQQRQQAFCVAVTATVDAMMDAYADAYDGAYDAAHVAAAGLALAGAIAAIVITGGAAAPLVLGIAIASAALLAAATYADSVTSANARNPEIRSLMSCVMYLSLKDQPINRDAFRAALSATNVCMTTTENNVRIALSAMFNSAYGDDLYMGFVQALGSATFAAQSGYELTGCTVCEDRSWCYEIYGRAEIEKWFNVTAGTWIGDTLYIGEVVGHPDYNWCATLEQKNSMYIPEGTTLTYVGVRMHKDPGQNHTQYLGDSDGVSNSVPGFDAYYVLTNAGAYNKTERQVRYVTSLCTNGHLQNGAITSVRIAGTGVPMFGICDNCL